MKIDRLTPPPVHEIGKLVLEPADDYVLENGIRLHVVSGSEIETNRMTVLLPGGSCDSKMPGMNELISKLLFEATEKLSAAEVANVLELNGAWGGSLVTTLNTSIDVFSMNSKFMLILPIVYDMIMIPRFEEESIEQHRRRMRAVQEIKMKRVGWLSDLGARKLMYGEDSNLAKTTDFVELDKVTRDELLETHRSRLDPQGIHIYLSGHVTEEMRNAVIEQFSKIPASVVYPLAEVTFRDEYSETTVNIDCPEAVQSAIKLLLPAVGRLHPDYIPLRMAVTALGGYFGSRLMLNIREDQGLTYGISAYLMGCKNKSFAVVATETDSANTERVIESVKEELEKMKDSASYTAEEINRLSKHVVSSLATILDTPFSRIDFIQTQITADAPPTYFADQECWARKISAETLSDIAKKYFDLDKLMIVTAG